jgi:hypothetical protein
MSAASSSNQLECQRWGMRDRREIIVSVIGYLLFVAMAVVVIAIVMTH